MEPEAGTTLGTTSVGADRSHRGHAKLRLPASYMAVSKKPATGNFIIADGLVGSPFNVIVTFTNPVSYAGSLGDRRTPSTNSMYTMVLLYFILSLALVLLVLLETLLTSTCKPVRAKPSLSLY
jgi:hypothetical protein